MRSPQQKIESVRMATALAMLASVTSVLLVAQSVSGSQTRATPAAGAAYSTGMNGSSS